MALLSCNPKHGWDLVSPCTQPPNRVSPAAGAFFARVAPTIARRPLKFQRPFLRGWLAPQRGILGASLVLHSLYRVAPLSPVLSIPRVRRAPTSLRSGLFL
jgi:hypothetical protein